ncbi:hypothetical protein ABPG74_003503 [Tetrahymena malaccensis]
MGQDCCTNRLKTQFFTSQRNQADTTSAFSQTTFNPFKNSLCISFLYLLTGKQVIIQNNLKMILQLAEQCSKNHICCYFEPDYLQKQHSLIEYQSPGSSFNRNNLAEAFWTDLEYFYEEEIWNEIFQFKVILLIETQGKGKHALTITRSMDPSRGNYFIVYDFLNRNRQYREKIFQDESSLNGYLNTIGEHFYVSYSPQPLSIKLLTFQFIDDKTESDIENLIINNSQMTNKSNNNNQNAININQISQYSISSQIQSQQQNACQASIQQQHQEQQKQENVIPLHIQLQQLPQAQGKSSNLNSTKSIHSMQSLNQNRGSIPLQINRNSSQCTPSEIQTNQPSQSICTLQQLPQHACNGQGQFVNQQIIIKLQYLNQNEQKYNYPGPSDALNKQKIINQSCSKNHDFYYDLNSQSTGIPPSKCSCGFQINSNINQINMNQSWEVENGLEVDQFNYYQNNAISGDQNADDPEILENGQSSNSNSIQLNQEDNQILDENSETPHSFHFQNNGIIHYGAEKDHEDFLSDDASEIQICIQSAQDLY